jgi:oxalate decarboxylase
MKKSSFKFKLGASKPTVDVKGGTVQEAKKQTFPVLDGLAMFLLKLKEGAVRIPHWHPDANELNIVLQGKARIALLGPDGPGQVKETFELEAGDISFMPQGWFHSIANIGEGELSMLVIFNNASPDDIGVSQALAGMADSVLGETLGVPPDTFKRFKKNVKLIAPQ